MQKAFVCDLRHFLNESGQLPSELPTTARRLAQFMANVIMQVSYPPSSKFVQLRAECPGTFLRKRCQENVLGNMDDKGCIWWLCPKCGDEGRINGWQGIYWDHSIN